MSSDNNEKLRNITLAFKTGLHKLQPHRKHEQCGPGPSLSFALIPSLRFQEPSIGSEATLPGQQTAGLQDSGQVLLLGTSATLVNRVSAPRGTGDTGLVCYVYKPMGTFGNQLLKIHLFPVASGPMDKQSGHQHSWQVQPPADSGWCSSQALSTPARGTVGDVTPAPRFPVCL